MSEVLLNGKKVDFSEVDPKKHKFIGMFRKPYYEMEREWGIGCYIRCSCQTTLQTVDQTYSHWQRGHFDIPQYADIYIFDD